MESFLDKLNIGLVSTDVLLRQRLVGNKKYGAWMTSHSENAARTLSSFDESWNDSGDTLRQQSQIIELYKNEFQTKNWGVHTQRIIILDLDRLLTRINLWYERATTQGPHASHFENEEYNRLLTNYVTYTYKQLADYTSGVNRSPYLVKAIQTDIPSGLETSRVAEDISRLFRNQIRSVFCAKMSKKNIYLFRSMLRVLKLHTSFMSYDLMFPATTPLSLELATRPIFDIKTPVNRSEVAIPNEIQQAAKHLSFFTQPRLSTRNREWNKIKAMQKEEWTKKDWSLHRGPLLVEPLRLTTLDLQSFYNGPLKDKDAHEYGTFYIDFNQHLKSLLVLTAHGFTEFLLGQKWCPYSNKTICYPFLKEPNSKETQAVAQGLLDLLHLFIQEPFVSSISSDNARSFTELLPHLSIHADKSDITKRRPIFPGPKPS